MNKLFAAATCVVLLSSQIFSAPIYAIGAESAPEISIPYASAAVEAESPSTLPESSGFSGFSQISKSIPVYPNPPRPLRISNGNAPIDPDFTVVNGVLTEYTGAGGELTLPSGVVEIGASVFAGNRNVIKVNFNSNLKVIGDRAFQGSGLTGTLVVPPSVESIGAFAFNGCASLTGLTLNRGLKIISDDAFSNCGKLAGSLKIPDTVTHIGARAFYLDTLLTGDLIIPDSVVEVGMTAFMRTGFDGQLVLSESMTRLNSYVFAMCSKISGTVRLPDSIISFGDSVFYDMSGIKGVIFGRNLTSTNSYEGFHGCSSVETVTFLGDAPPTVGFGGFIAFSSLKYIFVPRNSYDAYSAAFARYMQPGVKLVRDGDDPADPYAISINQTGIHTFPSLVQYYNQTSAKSVTIANIGSQPTGQLNIALSGANPSAFTLSETYFPSIERSGSRSFSVAPRLGLNPGTYSATVAISGGNGISASFAVNVTVNVPANLDYGIILGTSSTYYFSSLNEGYSSQKIVPAYIQVGNTGKLPTGSLSLSLSGKDAAAFRFPTALIESIPPSGIVTFSVAPGHGLPAGSYAASVNIDGAHGISASFDIRLTVNPLPLSAIVLDFEGTHVFPTVTAGYTSQEAPSKKITVTSVGAGPSGALLFSLSGANPNAFAFSQSSIPSIPSKGGTSSFYVMPKTGLAAGSYSATITLRGDGISESFGVSILVEPDRVYAISLDASGTYNFGPAAAGYASSPRKTVIVTNSGDAATGTLSISLLGSGRDAFSLSSTSLASLSPSRTSSFTVSPKTGLAAGVYSATVAVSGASASASFDVAFEVYARPDIALDVLSPYRFADLTQGYSTNGITAKTITISNISSVPTGNLTAALSGSGSSAFTVTPISISSIAPSNYSSVAVAPIMGLSAGSYEATLTVSGADGLKASCALVLTVAAPQNNIGIALSVSGAYIFPQQVLGYSSSALSANTVQVTNIGKQSTGSLSVKLSGHASAFTLSASSLSSIAAGASRSFTVKPKTGLAAGQYAATVTVSGSNGIAASFNVSFSVMPPTYSIALTTDSNAFPSQMQGYASAGLVAMPIKVANTGNRATGSLTLKLTGASSTFFTISASSLSSIAAGDEKSFTVKPKVGLVRGLYSGTISVSGSNGISETIIVTFKVI